MLNVSNNNLITMYAGDYSKTPLFINAGDEMEPLRYILQDNDTVYLSIEEPNQPFEFGIIRKTFTKDNLNSAGDVMIVLDSSDTENVLPGVYYYEVKLSMRRNNKNYIETIVPKRKFSIL